MTFPSPCPACAVGNHAEHDGSHHGPPGAIGGTQCGCSGDCVPPDLSSLFPVRGAVMSTLSPPMLHRLDLASHYIALGYRRARRIKQAENEQAARDFNEHAQQALNLARPLVVLPAPTLREWLDKAFDRIARDEAEDIDDQRRAASQEWSA